MTHCPIAAGQCTLPPVDSIDSSQSNKSRQPLLQVTSLGSGSSGNAFLINTGEAVIFVDCGVGVRRMTKALAMCGRTLASVDALLISHEHSDHVRELPRFAGNTAVASTAGTAVAARIPDRSRLELSASRPLAIAGIEVFAIPVSHDAREPSGFLLRTPAGSITILTDLGCPSPAATEAIAESDLVVLEANHDEALLRRGPYPAHLQRRILSDTGHLSNAACAELLATSLRGSARLPAIWLAHLSSTNNSPHLATRTVSRRLAQFGLHLDVQALPRRDLSPTWRPHAPTAAVAQLMLTLPDAAPEPGT